MRFTMVLFCFGLVFAGIILPAHSWVPYSSLQSRVVQQRTALRAEGESSSTNDVLSDIDGKTLYQRAFYQYTPGSAVDVHKSIVIEERCRFQADPDRDGYILPVGPRTLILRDGDVEDGEIGNDFYTIHCPGRHAGVATDMTVESVIATALFLASNPSLCSGEVMEVACESGLAGLLGCIGAAFVNGDIEKSKSKGADVADDILTISKEKDPFLPQDLQKLTLTDEDPRNLKMASDLIKKSGVSTSQVSVDSLDWRTRPQVRPLGRPVGRKEYRTVVASDIAFSYPEAKELARTVANHLESQRKYNFAVDNDSLVIPKFVHVCPEHRQDVSYLHNILEKGYKMTANTGYLKLEILKFNFQKLTNDEAMGDETSALDNLDLELVEVKEKKYQSLSAQHHPDYPGEGSGELFFPMETGEYDVTGGSTFLEPDAGASPW